MNSVVVISVAFLLVWAQPASLAAEEFSNPILSNIFRQDAVRVLTAEEKQDLEDIARHCWSDRDLAGKQSAEEIATGLLGAYQAYEKSMVAYAIGWLDLADLEKILVATPRGDVCDGRVEVEYAIRMAKRDLEKRRDQARSARASLSSIAGLETVGNIDQRHGWPPLNTGSKAQRVWNPEDSGTTDFGFPYRPVTPGAFDKTDVLQKVIENERKGEGAGAGL